MPVSNHSYIIVGDTGDNQRQFKIEYNGLDIFIENTLDQRYVLQLSKSDWEEMKKFIDEQFKKQ